MNKGKENKKPNKKDQKSKSKDKSFKNQSNEKNHHKHTDKKEEKKSSKIVEIKRPCGPYILFGKEIRPKIMKENPKLKAKEIISAIGEAWNNLSDGDKKKYQDMAMKEKERYEKECKAKGINPKEGKKKKKGHQNEKHRKVKKDEGEDDDLTDEAE